MCQHNDEDDCLCFDCCFEIGFDEAMSGLPYNPEFKNWEQVNGYQDGYNTGRAKYESKQNKQQT